MKRTYWGIIGWGVLVTMIASGCAMPVLRQDIPVSSNPMGAQVYVDGQPAGITPTTVSLERNRDHILTLVKDDYHQADVAIQRQYQREKVMFNAIRSGINAGQFHEDPFMGVSSGMQSVKWQEETGEAYLLTPSVVTITLMPKSGSSPAPQPLPPTSAPQSYPAMQPQTYMTPQPAPDMSRYYQRQMIKSGVQGGMSTMKPVEKKWETSSSHKTYVQPDGTVVEKKSSTSVGVSVDPSGIVDLVDMLFH